MAGSRISASAHILTSNTKAVETLGGADFSAPSSIFSVQNFHQSAAAEGDRFARLAVPGLVAGDAIDIHNK